MKHTEDFLKKYGILKLDENRYLMPDAEGSTDDKECIEYAEGLTIHKKELSGLIVNDGDYLIIIKDKALGGVYDRLGVHNINNYSKGYIEDYYFSDDGRYEVVCKLAKEYKDKRNVTIEAKLIYTEAEMKAWVDAIESI